MAAATRCRVDQIAPAAPPVTGDVLDYDEVFEKFDRMMEWLARTYVHAMNCIHYMHDKYFYERLEMALHDRDILRTMAFGIAGLSVVADSLAAIKYGKVRVIRDETGLAVDYVNESKAPVPQFGNNDDRVDSIASELVTRFMQKIRKHPTYRGATHTQSVLTITSNVVYGKHTGNTPDGRRKGEPFGPGANPMHGRDSHGWLASCLSVAKLPYKDSLDGISYTVSVAPQKAHWSEEELVDGATKAFDMYFGQGGFHMNLNVLDKDTLRGCDGASGQVSAAHNPRVGLRRQLHTPDARAAAGRDQPNLPRPDLKRGRAPCRSSATSWRAAGTTCTSVSHRTRRMTSELTKDTDGAFGYVHSYETGSRYDGPGHAGRAVPVGLPASLQLLPQSRYLALEGRHLRFGRSRSSSRLGDFAPALRCARRRSDHLGRGAAGADRLYPPHPRGGQGDGPPHGDRDLRLSRRSRADDEFLSSLDLVLLDIKSGDPGDLSQGDRPRRSRRRCASPSGWQPSASRHGCASRSCQG